MTLKGLDALTLLVVILGGLNWGLVGIFDFDAVTMIFGHGGEETATSSAAARFIYGLFAAAALWQVGALFRGLLVREGD